MLRYIPLQIDVRTYLTFGSTTLSLGDLTRDAESLEVGFLCFLASFWGVNEIWSFRVRVRSFPC